MDFFLYLICSIVYIMLIHFAIAIKKEFNLWLMIAMFVFAGALGWYFHEYMLALVGAMILSLMLW